jgi:hypothetical protein
VSKHPVTYIDIDKLKSKWHKDLLSEWQPDRGYIDYIKNRLKEGEYIAPIVAVKEGDDYFIVNGHHRCVAHLESGKSKIKCIVIEGTFDDTEPLRKAENLLKEYDRRTEYRCQFSGYLDRWAAAAEENDFINRYRPTYKFRLYKLLKKLVKGFKSLIIRS